MSNTNKLNPEVKMNKSLSGFVNKYPISKTLRFALKPIGKTEKHIRNKGLLKEDKERVDNYIKAKKIIDEYHKDLIHRILNGFAFGKSELEGFADLYKETKSNSIKETREELSKKQNKLRKLVADKFKNNELFKKEFIEEILPEWLEKPEASESLKHLKKEGIDDPQTIIKGFKKWTTYFKGFWENRKNVYTEKDHSTSIGYRLIHENLPKFLDNKNRYEKAKEHGVDFSEVKNASDISVLESFNQYLTQEGIDQYNSIIGGISQEDVTKQKGVNEIINLYVQQIDSEISNTNDEKKDVLKSKRKAVRSCKMEQLYKQILSDRNTISFRGNEPIKDDAELCELIKDKDISTLNNIDDDVKKCLVSLKEADPKNIYVKKESLTVISRYLFGSWNTISNCLEYYVENVKYPAPKGKKETKELLGNRKKYLKQSYLSFYDIHDALEEYFKQYTDEDIEQEVKEGQQSSNGNMDIKEQKNIAMNKPLLGYFTDLTIKKWNEKTKLYESKDLFEEIRAAYKDVLPILEKYENTKEEKIKKEKKEVKTIKDYLDALMDLQYFLKPLYFQLKKKEEEQTEEYKKDGGFYSEFDELYKKIGGVISLYNQTRNYLTKKPYSVDKYKLNFENSTLADGWDENKEPDNTCVILLKDGHYFLGVMDKEHNRLFKDKDKNELSNNGECYQKMVYKLLPLVNQMLPKVFFSKKNIDNYSPSQEILEIRNHASYAKNGKPQTGYVKKAFALDDMRKMVDFYKKSITKHPDWKGFNFQFSSTKDYKNISEFYREVEQQGYKVTFINISEDYIDRCVEEGRLYLFRIYTKDFSSKTKGRPNLQTLYWKTLFDEENLKDVVYKLNGEAELFYRKASISYSAEERQKGHHADDPKKKQKYPIIKDRRYAKDTYLFHVPVTCNFKANGVSKFNDQVQDFLKGNPDINIIGIDRGERHLAYYTVINQEREILKDEEGNYLQGSFNSPFGKKDYHDLLDRREKERDKARKSWETIEKIKDLKEGYLSQVVHKIAKLMIEHNAIVIFEDLNFGFKRGRFKIEKQVYQKLEKLLIEKLNYLVFKDRDVNEVGGTLKALQLTSPFESFKKLEKQTGCIFYVPAYHTSKVCPATGFVNLLYPKYETVKKSRDFLKEFDKICFNENEGYFEFHFNYKKFTNKAEGSKQNWIVCSYGERLENFRNKQKNNNWNTREINLTREMKKLFGGYGIDFENDNCLKNQIIQQNDSKFFKSVIHLLRLTMQMRNSRIGTEEDWLISPVKDKNDNFFDSRKVEDNSMPKDADANGAYHIALKGSMMLQQLNRQKIFKPDMSNKAWYEFLQGSCES